MMPSTVADRAPAARPLPDPGPTDHRDEAFAALLALAADVLDCAHAMLWVADGAALRMAAVHGLDAGPEVRGSVLATALGPDTVAVIPDAAADARFQGDVLVAAPQGIRFFAAVALVGAGGELLGVLGAGDHRVRPGTPLADLVRLQSLAVLGPRVFEHGALARCRQVAEVGFSAIVVVDHHDIAVFTNAAARDLFGPGATAGQPLDRLVPAALQVDAEAVASWLRPAHRAGDADLPSTRELRIRDAAGELRTVEAVRCAWRDGQVEGLALVMRDVTDDGGMRREPRSRRRDSLTGLPNREALFATIESLRAQGIRIAVALVGLDNFRGINEALGHAIGDTVLQVVACRLMAWLPSDAHLARFGSDEFAIVFPAPADADLEPRLQGLLRDVARPCEVEHQRVHVEGCIGLAFDAADGSSATSQDDNDSSGVLALAALAMRHAKRAGTMQVRRFSPAMREEAMDRRHLDLELRRAFRDSEFELHYQPQIDLATGSPSGAEALLRWRHPERGLLMPVAFIDALARSTIAPAVGAWILERACRDAAAWPVMHGRPLNVGVNLFPSQFDDVGLVDRIDEALAASGLPATQLEIELTETIALRDDGVAEKTLLQLRRRGIRVSYDDFGTGHASLSMLHRLPVDRVKIDRSFVRDLVGSRGDKAIVRSIALMAKNFDMQVIAEGVENQDQVELLREFGCQEVQGFLYSRALASAVFDDWLANHVPRVPELEAAHD